MANASPPVEPNTERSERLVFERKHTYTHLKVFEVVVTEVGKPADKPFYLFRLTGGRCGEGSSETWACRNRWRCTNAGKNNQARMDKRYNYQAIKARSFRGRF